MLCKENDNSCYFKKVTRLYADCTIDSKKIGKGTEDDPINLLILNEIGNLDEIILSEKNYDLAIVAFNEISLKIIELEIVFKK